MDFKKFVEDWAKAWFSFKFLGIFAVFKDQIRASLKIWGRYHAFFPTLDSILLYSILAEVTESILVLIVIYASIDNCTVSSFTIW